MACLGTRPSRDPATATVRPWLHPHRGPRSHRRRCLVLFSTRNVSRMPVDTRDSMLVARRVGTTLLLVLLTAACWGDTHEFFDQPTREQDSLFLTYSPSEQVEIYVQGVTRVHPPVLALAYPLASNGRSVIPALLGELQRTDSDLVRMELLRVLALMSCHYEDLSGSEDVIAPTSEVLTRMTVQSWRAGAEEYFRAMKGECLLIEQPAPPSLSIELLR